MSAQWASVVIVALVAAAGLAAFIWRDGQTRGRQTAILERLTELAEDHDRRLRALEVQQQHWQQQWRRR